MHFEERKKKTVKTKGRTLSEDPEGLTQFEIPQATQEPGEYKFIVLTGNYPQSVREMLKVRANWKEVEDDTLAIESAHFMWKPCNYGSGGFEKMTKRMKSGKYPFIYNHFEYIRCI
jgi:hypothetical protein